MSRLTGSSLLACCSAAAPHHMRCTSSSTRWCRMPPTGHCCGANDNRSTRTSPQCSKNGLAIYSIASPSCWPTISPRERRSNARYGNGFTPARTLPRVRLTWKRSVISGGVFHCWLHCRRTQIAIGRKWSCSWHKVCRWSRSKGSTRPRQWKPTRARDTSVRRRAMPIGCSALWNLWVTTVLRDIDTARRLSNKLLILTQTQKDSVLRLEAHHTAWFTRFYLGDPAAACGHCDEGCRLYDFERHRSLALLYGGHDPGVCARYVGAWADWLLGYPDKALASINAALDLAERLAHPLSLDMTYLYAAVLHLFRREPEIALQRTRAAEVLASEQRLALMIEPNMLRSSALLAQGAVKQAGESIGEGLAARQKMGSYMFRAYDLALLSEVLERAGDHEGALAALTDALAIGKESGERWWEAEIHRLRGTFMLSRRRFAESEACFRRSIRIAQRQQAKSLELRGAMSLAQFWRDRGQHERAHSLLAPVYGWFTEGFDTRDLKEAKALLSELH